MEGEEVAVGRRLGRTVVPASDPHRSGLEHRLAAPHDRRLLRGRVGDHGARRARLRETLEHGRRPGLQLDGRGLEQLEVGPRLRGVQRVPRLLVGEQPGNRCGELVAQSSLTVVRRQAVALEGPGKAPPRCGDDGRVGSVVQLLGAHQHAVEVEKVSRWQGRGNATTGRAAHRARAAEACTLRRTGTAHRNGIPSVDAASESEAPGTQIRPRADGPRPATALRWAILVTLVGVVEAAAMWLALDYETAYIFIHQFVLFELPGGLTLLAVLLGTNALARRVEL